MGWGTTFANGSGSITVTTLTDTHATGTFSFTAAPDGTSQSTTNLVVTNGTFDLSVTTQ